MNTELIRQFFALPDEAGARMPYVKAVLACSNATIWRLAKQNKITAVKVSRGVTLFNVGSIRALLNANSSTKQKAA
jgi:hypothetical protein